MKARASSEARAGLPFVPSLYSDSGRLRAVDAIRGLAIVLLVVDHLCLLAIEAGGPSELALIRLTVGRVAMPLFFLIAGLFAGRVTARIGARHFGVLAVGLTLPGVVGWIDSPNVLVWWVAGCAVLVAMNRLGIPTWVVPLLALTFAANHWGVHAGSSYDPVALLGIMGLGACLPVTAYAWGGRLPAWLEAVGRWPLTLYVGHLLVLQLAYLTFTL